MTEWNISEEAAALHQDALMWDNTLPWGDAGRPQSRRNACPGWWRVVLTLFR